MRQPKVLSLLAIITLFAAASTLTIWASFTPPSSVPYNAAAYADRAKLGNATGLNDLGAYAGPAACPEQVNLFSKNVGYSFSVLSLPGRAGLHLGLSLFYNSKVWVKSGSTIYFDGDKGWPGVGWRLGFGRIDGVYAGPDGYNHYYLISGDGSVRDLRYNSSTSLYESRDSTFIDFNDATGVLRYKDGTQVTYAAVGGFVQPTQIKDRNGNYININYTGTGQQILSVVDTVGRTVSFSYNPDTTLNTITKTGFGGAARTWSFGYTNVTLTYGFATSLTVNGPASGSQVKVLSSITFPNSTQIAFTYNSYAQLTEAAAKSSSGTLRGKCLTSWQTAPGGGWTDSPTPASVGNFDGTSTNNWTLAFNSYSTTVTNPASVPSTANFVQTGSWDDGLPSQTQTDSPVLRTMANVWVNDGSMANPRVLAVTSTLNDSGQQSKVEFDYTSYGNTSEVREFDYALVLVRRTAASYVTDFNYTSRHILALPQSITLYDAAWVTKAQTSFTYDSGALTYAGGATNHDDASYGTGFFYRGLVTIVSRPSFSSSPTVTNTASYDMLGNTRTESADCCVQRQYNFSSATQYAFPDSIVRGSGTTLTTSATYDGSTGLVATSTDENNKVTTYSYDVTDRLTTLTRPDNVQFNAAFDDSSATASRTLTTPIETGKSVKQKTEFDGLGHPIRAITLDASSSVYSKADALYDSVGRRWKVSNPYTGASASYWTETQYDSLSRTTKVIPPDGTQFSNNITYSYSGNEVTVTDQAGKQRKSKTDALGRQIEVDESDPLNGNSLTLVTTYGYDPMDNLTQVNQGVQGRSNTYDGLSRLLSEATSEAGTVSYEYGSYSLLMRRTDARGVVTHYYYDSSLNRLTQMTYDTAGTSAAATSAVSFTYGTNPSLNNNGRLITKTYGTFGADTESYTYDQLGRTTQVQKYFYFSGTYTTNYTYNLASQVATMTYPSGRVFTNTYDAIGRPQYLSDNSGNNFVSNAQYNPANQATGFFLGNGVSASFGYSAQRLQLTSISYTQGQALLSLSYGYSQNGGNNGQITSITDNVQLGRSVNYTYDSLYRLKTAATSGSGQYPQWGLQWTYDRYGNTAAQSVTAGSAPSYAVTLNQTTNRIIDPGFSYDASGNMTADGGQNWMGYDAENRMVSTTGGGGSASFTYDGNGLRATKQLGGSTTTYIYSGQKLIAEYPNGGLSKEYVYAGGQLIATLQGGMPTYHLRDHLSIRVNTNSGGGVIGEQGHYPFGEQWYATGGTSNFVFTSYQRDSESGNDNAVSRTRSTRFGRFNMSDPDAGSVAAPQSLNRYAYTRNDPVSQTDPLGLSASMWQSQPYNDDSRGCRVDGYAVYCAFSNSFVQNGAAAALPPGISPVGFAGNHIFIVSFTDNGLDLNYPGLTDAQVEAARLPTSLGGERINQNSPTPPTNLQDLRLVRESDCQDTDGRHSTYSLRTKSGKRVQSEYRVTEQQSNPDLEPSSCFPNCFNDHLRPGILAGYRAESIQTFTVSLGSLENNPKSYPVIISIGGRDYGSLGIFLHNPGGGSFTVLVNGVAAPPCDKSKRTK